MPWFGLTYWKCGDCWFDKTQLEKFLIVTVISSVIVIIILSAVGKYGAQEELCKNAECLREASRVLTYINNNIDPCDNFWKFVCSDFDNNAGKNERISLDAYRKEQLLAIYKEGIKPSEHRMVKAAKKLFQACTNEVDIEKDGVETLREALKIAGGWPVLEGENWNEKDYEWKKSTYKLRELGYEYFIFLELSLVFYPGRSDKFIFQVTSPDTEDYRYGLFNLDKVELMTDIVEMFNKTNKTQIRAEMEEVHSFWKLLQEYDHPFYVRSFKKYTVEEYQKFAGSFDWLEFINKVSGPTATITKDEYIMFPDPQNLTTWLEIINKTPKRVQANYMMWKVVEATIPYLNRELRYGKIGLKKKETHEEFCLSETEKRFYPSPISVLNDRRHITVQKKKVLEELLSNVRIELMKIIKSSSWLKDDERNKTLNKIEKMKFLIGQPSDYFQDKILDDVDVDMITVRNETFLNLLAQANRNAHSWVYNQIKQTLAEAYVWKFHIRFDNGQPGYGTLDNSLFIPGVSIQDLLFHDKRPHYINYGSMAALLGYHVTSVLTSFMLKLPELGGWSNRTQNEYARREKCLTDSIKYYSKEYREKNPLNFIMTDWSKRMYYTKEHIALQATYAAYESWLEKHGDERKLLGLDYTPRQLFWMYYAVTFCNSKVTRDFETVTPEVVLTSLANNVNFAKDFGCQPKSYMNPDKKCQIFN
ncbi:hypothetical protein FQA39_LY09390 [Lamprigera yunnana]|nr:hypothetical protein FQA39_LY09390 [Lamprigera yunnana]